MEEKSLNEFDSAELEELVDRVTVEKLLLTCERLEAKMNILIKEVNALGEAIKAGRLTEETHIHHHYSPPHFPQPSRKPPWIKEPEWWWESW